MKIFLFQRTFECTKIVLVEWILFLHVECMLTVSKNIINEGENDRNDIYSRQWESNLGVGRAFAWPDLKFWL